MDGARGGVRSVRVAALLSALALLVTSPTAASDRSGLPPPCDSLIYCHGPLLDTVQMAGLYNDSKTFVDMKIKYSANITIDNFHDMMNRTNQKPTKADIQEFVNQNFDPADTEFEDWTATDWKANPGFLQRINDPVLKEWASSLNYLWLELGRKMKDEVKVNQELYSIIYVENPVIVPGGRFREFYYWDSYWIIRGLLLSEMHTTVRGMLANFLDVVERFGHIPNGGRIYYVMRSQPPMLIPMVKSYMDDMGDLEFMRRYIHTLEREFDFWMNNHMVEVEHDGQKYKLARYADWSQGPRPESYREDIESAALFDTNDKKEEHYAELKAAAESGWDFSSRWFVLNGTNKGNLTNLKTRSIIPVDLNAIMCWNSRLMAEFYEKLGNKNKMLHYKEKHAQFMEAIDKVLWHEEVGAWLDHNVELDRRRDYFYPTNVAPLWTDCYDRARKDYYVSRVINYLDKVKVDNFEAGIPTTFEHSGEQWDYPNAWPPLQYIMVVGLERSGVPAAMRLAREWAAKWVRSNFMVWQHNKAMLEKYDATIVGGIGGGGEYDLQKGFGWTNGVIMEMLNTYGDSLSAVDAFEDEAAAGAVTEGAAGTVTTPATVAGAASERASAAGAPPVLGAAVGAGGVITALLVVAASLSAGALGYLMKRCFLLVTTYCPLQTFPKLAVYRRRRDFTLSREGARLLRRDVKSGAGGLSRPFTELRSMAAAADASRNGKPR